MNLQVAETVVKTQQSYRRNVVTVLSLGLRIGDGILLLTVFTLLFVLFPTFHLQWINWRYFLVTWNNKLSLGILALVLWNVSASLTRMYEQFSPSNRFRILLNMHFTLMLALIFWTLLALAFFIKDIGFSIKLVLIFFVISLPILSIWRILFAIVMDQPQFRHQAVIVGTTSAAKAIAKELQNLKRPYATFLGYISESLDSSPIDGIQILGGRSVLRHLGQNGLIDMIIMAVDFREFPELFHEAIEMAQLGITVLPMALAYENMSGRIPVEHVGDQWYLALPLNAFVSSLYTCWRKVIDVVFGLVGTAVLLLILPILSFLIYIDSPGPIFYSQERLGLKGKPFRIYKFRSMRTDAEYNGQAVWTTQKDTRITRVGRFMRGFHLDEIPQVLNILRGEMSLIGPRPEREEFVLNLEKKIPFYRCRLAVKPGLTGWAQVKYHYSSTDDEALIKVQYDLFFIKHQSIMLDIFIILMTVGEVLLRRGT